MFCLSSKKCAALPTHSQRTVSLVSVSLSHINMPQSLSSPSLSLSSCCLSSPLTQPPLWRQLSFCLAVVRFWPLLCQSVANYLLSLQAPGCLFSMSTPSVPLALFCHPHSSIFLALSSPIISCLVLQRPFFFPVLSFIHSSHLLFIPPLSFLCLTGPQRFLLKRIPSTGD